MPRGTLEMWRCCVYVRLWFSDNHHVCLLFINLSFHSRLRAHRKTNVQHLALVTWFGSPGRRKNIKEASESVREQLLQLVRADRGRSVRVYMGLLAESTQRGMAGRTSWPTLPEFLSALEAAGQVLIARAGDTHWEWTLRPGEGVTARAQARTQWESDDGGAVLSSSVRESSSVVQDRSASSVEVRLYYLRACAVCVNIYGLGECVQSYTCGLLRLGLKACFLLFVRVYSTATLRMRSLIGEAPTWLEAARSGRNPSLIQRPPLHRPLLLLPPNARASTSVCKKKSQA